MTRRGHLARSLESYIRTGHITKSDTSQRDWRATRIMSNEATFYADDHLTYADRTLVDLEYNPVNVTLQSKQLLLRCA